MPLEKSLLDKFVNGAFLGKRKIGRPIKYNIRSKGFQGWVELVFNPRSKLEQYVSRTLRFIHPYLFYVTYRFHVEKAREAGKFQSNLNNEQARATRTPYSVERKLVTSRSGASSCLLGAQVHYLAPLMLPKLVPSIDGISKRCVVFLFSNAKF